MRIEEVKTFLVEAQRQNWLFIKITTDSGIYGWGEASIESNEKIVESCIDRLAQRFLIGQDPLQVENIWRKMYHEFWKGGYVKMTAISGIDMALWDILGKYLNVPCYVLFGGKVRDKIRSYTHLNSHVSGRDGAEEAYMRCFDQGYGGIKVSYELHDPDDVKDILSHTREKLGPTRDIMIDQHGRLAGARAIPRIMAAAPYGLLFYEEPVAPENPDEYKVVRAGSCACGVALAAGERTFSRFDARPLIEGQLIDYYQPDICHCGGISEMRRLASYAEVYHIKMAPHNPNGPVATAASLQCAAAMKNFYILEFASTTCDRSDIFDLDVTSRDGYFSIPERPGLGVDMDESKFGRYPFVTHDFGSLYEEDGSIIEG